MFLLLLTVLHFSSWDGTPKVVYQEKVYNLTEASCTAAATQWQKQYQAENEDKGVGKNRMTVLCIKQEEPKK